MFFLIFSSLFQVYSYLSNLHKDLQKFAIALEAVTQTEPQKTIVKDTHTRLIQVRDNEPSSIYIQFTNSNNNLLLFSNSVHFTITLVRII